MNAPGQDLGGLYEAPGTGPLPSDTQILVKVSAFPDKEFRASLSRLPQAGGILVPQPPTGPGPYVLQCANLVLSWVLAGQTGPATTTAPVVSYSSTTRKLTATHPQGGTLLYSYQNGAFVTYTAAIQVDGAAHPAGSWRFKRQADSAYLESPVANSPAIAAATAPKRMLVGVGDSTTAGFTLADYNGTISPSYAWPAVLARQGASLYGLVSNRGRSGNTVRDVINRVASIRADYNTTDYAGVDVPVLLGLNDIQQGRTTAQITADLTELYGDLQATGVVLYAVTLPAAIINTSNAGPAAYITQQINALNAQLRANFASYGAYEVIDLAGRAEMQNPDATYFSMEANGNFLHPNTSGHAAMADAILMGVSGVMPYTGAIGPYFVETENANPSYHLLTGPYLNDDNPKARGGREFYWNQPDSGTVTLRFRGTGFDLWAITDPPTNLGQISYTLNGGAPVTVNQAVINQASGADVTASWAYYSSPDLPAGDYEVVLTMPASGKYKTYDGFYARG